MTQAHRFSFGKFWDPDRTIQNGIDMNLAMLAQEKTDRTKIIAAGEWLGKEMEEEIDRAQRQESQERSRDGTIRPR